MKPLELKARLLTEGANPDGKETVEFLQEQNPQQVLRGGLSSGLKVKLLGDREFKVNFPLYSQIPVPLKIRVNDSGLVILENDEEIGKAEVLRAPAWYKEQVDNYPITSILTQHSDQVIGSVFEWCSLFDTGEQCKFCVINQSQKRPELKNIRRKAELLIKALKVIPRDAYKGIGLNGGMTFSDQRGLELMTPVIRKIRDEIGEIPMAVEITPPQDLSAIDEFAEAGGNSLMMNLETWDEDIRGDLMPGKTKYCPKDSYFKAFERALKVLGEGKVSTCFVVGTEPIKSLKQGIEEVVNFNVIPSPLCGRYFEDIPNYPFKPNGDWKEFLEAFMFAREKMAEKGLATKDEAGCIACGMCDTIGD